MLDRCSDHRRLWRSACLEPLLQGRDGLLEGLLGDRVMQVRRLLLHFLFHCRHQLREDPLQREFLQRTLCDNRALQHFQFGQQQLLCIGRQRLSLAQRTADARAEHALITQPHIKP